MTLHSQRAFLKHVLAPARTLDVSFSLVQPTKSGHKPVSVQPSIDFRLFRTPCPAQAVPLMAFRAGMLEARKSIQYP
jgi:hypothetical protein